LARRTPDDLTRYLFHNASTSRLSPLFVECGAVADGAAVASALVVENPSPTATDEGDPNGAVLRLWAFSANEDVPSKRHGLFSLL